MPRKTDINGDARYDYDAHANNYYTLQSTLDELTPAQAALYGIEDSENGYIAFASSQEFADLIVRALDAYEGDE